MSDPGCDYCRDDQSRFFGRVTPIASQDVRLGCPRCSALYENSSDGPDHMPRLTER
jgi:hypothetical protein